VFFLSYHRPVEVRRVATPQDSTRHVKRFFDDLTENVNELIGTPAGQDPGFLDTGRGGSEHWEQTVLGAVGTAQVLICLLSRPFLLHSPWCCMEWDAFARRAVVPRPGTRQPAETAIIPVLWAPFREAFPPRIAKVNLFQPNGLPDESYIASYLNYGLLGLLRTGQSEIYETFVWKLAMHVQRIHSLYWVEPNIPSGPTGLRTSFQEGVP
jgi:hypothetical protein